MIAVVRKHAGRAYFAAVFLVFSVLAVNPADLRKNLDGWLDPVGGFAGAWPPALAVVVTAVGCIAYFRVFPRSGTLCSRDEYLRQVRDALDDGSGPVVVKVFGYTGETVVNDILAYGDRYEARITVRMLNRNWCDEAKDEDAFNASPGADLSRPWAKSQAIRNIATVPWPHPMRREIRYFSTAPVIKGIVVCDANGSPTAAWISFFHWQERPVGGGSPFKGMPEAFLSLRATRAVDRHMLSYVDSQFDRMWITSSTTDEVRAAEQR